MEELLIIIFLLAAGVWTGTIVFQSAVVTPTVFTGLDETQARVFLRTLFPRFFRLGLVCGIVMATVLAVIAVSGAASNTLTAMAVLTAIMLIFGAISLALVPLINAARDAGPPGAARFKALHRLSVILTVLVLMLGVAAIATVGGTASLAGAT